MKLKYTGDQDEITIRGVTFTKGRPVAVDCPDLAQKLVALPYFSEVKSRGKKQI